MKLLWIFRAIFLVIIVAIVFVNISSPIMDKDEVGDSSTDTYNANLRAIIFSSIGMAVFVLLLDIMTPKKKFSALAGVFFGLLVGILVSWALAPVVNMVSSTFSIDITDWAITVIKWLLGICICYLTISIVMRTKDDVRFVIPYVEFAKQTKGSRPLVIDTSAIIDGRIVDLCQSKLFDAPLIVPRFVLNELQLISDSADKLKRNRGRRGLDILSKMQSDPVIDVVIDDSIIAEVEEVKGVDQKLLMFSKACNGRLATTDYNLSKVARVREVDVVNINDLANSLKVVALPGEAMQIKIIKPGEEAEQGIGYLDDGTMVVVEGARNKIGRELVISITSSLQTSAGKMIFGKFEGFAQENKGAAQETDGSNRRRPYRKQVRSNTSGDNRNKK
ncbi:MAG TPA: TRAM domain-containing protein [Sedimentisphaerales bacterium]|nr:TRAM domain-containing protein [Sedimentisphaerales bacterium]